MKKALVAVSGGSDSLALLDILHKENKFQLIVCHVNYHYRNSSNRDEKLVVEFCEQRKIRYYLLQLNSVDEKEGNFEDWARVKRYKYFKEIYDKEMCECLFVGHQKDDVIETYLIQQQRNALVDTYGLANQTIIQGMKVIRPLLNFTKKDLEIYCLNNNIAYGVDETNFDLNYSRNKIRHELVDKMSDVEKNNIISEIEEKNNLRQQQNKAIKDSKLQCQVNFNKLNLEKFNALPDEHQLEVLYHFIIENIYKRISVKKGRLLDIIKKIHSTKPNIELAQYDNMILYKEYNFLVIEENKKEYSYKIENDLKLEDDSGYYISKFGCKLEKVIARKDQFPLYLKNYDGNNKKINRIFINKKIPLRERKQWPIIVDNFGGLLLVINIKKFYNEVCNCNESLIDFYVCKNKGE